MNIIFKGIIIGITGVLLVGFLVIYILPDITATYNHQQKDQWINENFENPVVYQSGLILEGNNPCAMYSDPSDCLDRKASADQRNLEIQRKNMKTWLSIEQHENPLVTPKLNYYLYNQNEDAQKAIESGNCERIEEHLYFANKSFQQVDPGFTDGHRIMQIELIADHELNLQICNELYPERNKEQQDAVNQRLEQVEMFIENGECNRMVENFEHFENQVSQNDPNHEWYDTWGKIAEINRDAYDENCQ